MLHVVNAEYIAGYRIKVSFNDGVTAVADFSETIQNDERSIIRNLSDLDLFRCFKIQANTITWTNGVDFAPEFIKSIAK